jgi:uncharacterized membrane protein
VTVAVEMPTPMVVVPTAVATTLVVVVHMAHERLLAQGCCGMVQMEVVMVDRHELPAPVTIGNVVGGAVVVSVSVGRFVGSVVVVNAASAEFWAVARSRVSN